MKKVIKRLIASTGAINVDLGFIPDYAKVIAGANATLLSYEWFKALEDAGDSGQYGFLDTASTGVVTLNASAAAGIAAYEGGKAVKVKIPAPDGDGYSKASVSDFVAGAAQPTARTTSVVGTVKRPSTHNGFVYECTVSGGVLGTEPTWPTTPGETVSDGNNTWICRREDVVFEKVAGITIGASITTDSDEIVVIAEQFDRDFGDAGDAAAADPI